MARNMACSLIGINPFSPCHTQHKHIGGQRIAHQCNGQTGGIKVGIVFLSRVDQRLPHGLTGTGIGVFGELTGRGFKAIDQTTETHARILANDSACIWQCPPLSRNLTPHWHHLLQSVPRAACLLISKADV